MDRGTMKKVGLIGVLLLPQAKSSTGCYPHIHLVKEEERCIADLLLYKSERATENNNSVLCKGMWDDLNCWPAASLGQTVTQPCPEFFNSAGTVQRNCTASGWTDPLVPHEDACGYTFNETLHFLGESSDAHTYFSYVKTMYTAGYALSLISLSIAVTIFCLFRWGSPFPLPPLPPLPNALNQRMLTCPQKAPLHQEPHPHPAVRLLHPEGHLHLRPGLPAVHRRGALPLRPLPGVDRVACKAALMFSNYSILANYSWLLAEGHFLFTLVSRSFFSLRKHLAWYIVLSWGLPLTVIVSWGCAKYFYEDEGCWETRTHEWIWWILRVPVLLTISMNFFFFLGILRILVSKLRMPDAQRNEFCQYKTLIKSTFFLVALFGLHYILFVFLPVEVSSSVFKIWTFAELALSSTQGFVVAVLYCFMNGEVQQEIQRRWRRWRLTQHLPSRRRRQQHGSISHSGSPLTQVSLLPCSTGGPTAGGLPVDTLEV
uniref:secretin receptor isoform X1 n=1 Tax=Gasterosteus aculeatus aculeatus TaxID=481459 RepID=UPI001A9A0809|nr:secretin receptor isoform X1 [Gasterosteus aculeatus aculeatus]